MKKINQQSGFTVIETLVVITAISLIAGVAAISLAKGKTATQEYTETEKVAQIIREAQSKSLTAESGKSWMVRCSGNSVELISVNPEVVHEEYEFPSRFSCSSMNDIHFEKLTGIPVQDIDLNMLYEGVNSSKIEIRIPGTIKIIAL